MIRLAYFGYPIDQNWSTKARGAIENARVVLCDRLPFYDPQAAFKNMKEIVPGPEIWMVNHRALTMSQVALFVLPAGVPSIGVPREIQIAIHAGIPTAVLTDAPSWSLPIIRGQNFETFALDAAEAAITWLEATHRRVGDVAAQAKLPVLIRDKGGQLPARHYTDDAGLDLYVSQTTKIEPGTFADVATGISVELPSSTWGMIKSRSSTLRQKGLLVHDGVIDPGWRGYLFAGVWNLTETPVVVTEGERIAQLILFTNVTAMYEPVEVLTLTPSERGTNGFGSTGG